MAKRKGIKKVSGATALLKEGAEDLNQMPALRSDLATPSEAIQVEDKVESQASAPSLKPLTHSDTIPGKFRKFINERTR